MGIIREEVTISTRRFLTSKALGFNDVLLWDCDHTPCLSWGDSPGNPCCPPSSQAGVKGRPQMRRGWGLGNLPRDVPRVGCFAADRMQLRLLQRERP